MFGFWKKKGGEIPEEQLWQKSAEQRARERQEAGAVPQALRALGQEFLPEELEVLAVTGATPFSGSQGEEGDGLWPASIGLTAWMEADSPELHQGEFRLETIADNQLMPVMRQRARPDFIIRFQARRSEDGTRLLLLDLPEPGFDPDLKAILDEQKKPVTFWAEGLGTFALNRALGWFEAEADWLGSPIRLDLDRDEDREKCLSHLRALMAGQAPPGTCWSWPTTGPATGAVRSVSRRRSPGGSSWSGWSQTRSRSPGTVPLTSGSMTERCSGDTVFM